MKKFTDYVDEKGKNKSYGICCVPTSDRECMDFLTDYLLGEKFYVTVPMSHDQTNTEIVHTILFKYSKKYRKEYKNWIKKGAVKK